MTDAVTDVMTDVVTPVEREPRSTRCCIVGGGPGGMVLGLLLARRGVPVTVLEAHHDFDRDFRGDTVHPSTLEMLADIGLAQRVLALEHAELHRMTIVTPRGALPIADFGALRVPYPYIAMIPQVQVLELLAEEAGRLEAFELRMGCRVTELLQDGDGTVVGVRHEGPGGPGELRATLVVGADGRGSPVRRLAGLPARSQGGAMDVLWLRVPRTSGVPADRVTGLRVGPGRLIVVLNRAHEWQIGYVMPKGGAKRLREAGLDALRASVLELAPDLTGDLEALTDWEQTRLLAVESSRAPRWHRPGLLLIGDAAHTMSPIGGVGINYAVQDAVAAANRLAEPLLAGTVTDAQLADVQRRRELPTRFIQWFQRRIERSLVRRALDGDERPFRLPLLLRVVGALPLLRRIPARLIGWGLRPERVDAGTLGR